MMLVGEACPTCTKTDNYSHPWTADLPTARSVIDAAIAATDTNPSGGNVDWAFTSDHVRSETAILVSPLELGNGLSPFVNAQVLGNVNTPQPFDVSARNILVYSQGGPHWNYNSPSFVPGAGIGYGVTSSSGYLPYDGNQTNAASWLSQGAVGAYGNSVEPCELLVYKSPDPALVVPNYTQGQTLIESLWKSVRLPWGGNFIGDPLAAPFRLQAGSGNPAPDISSIAPASGTQGSVVNVTLTGTNFSAGATVSVSGTGVTVSNVSVVTTSRITATLTIAANAQSGSHTLTASSSGGSDTVSFIVNATQSALPSLTSLAAASANVGTAVPVTLSGANFAPGSQVVIAGAGVVASNVSVANATTITATFTVAGNAAAGNYNVAVTGATGTTNTMPFTVTTSAAPTLLSLSPSSASVGTSVSVTLTGTNFNAGTGVRLGGIGASFSNVVVVSPTQITVTFKLLVTTLIGPHNVYVVNSSGSSNILPFDAN